MRKNKPPIRLALNKAASDEVYLALQALHGTRSNAALAQDMGVPVSEMQDSIEAHYQASLKTARGS